MDGSFGLGGTSVPDEGALIASTRRHIAVGSVLVAAGGGRIPLGCPDVTALTTRHARYASMLDPVRSPGVGPFWPRWVGGDRVPILMWRKVLLEGVLAGAAGMVAMTATEKLEQRVTRRPDSHVPARVLERLVGAPHHDDGQLRIWNLAMHYGQGIALGPIRSLMAHAGLRGPVASAKFTVVRLTNDQILENLTGVGAPPQTWPRAELIVDVIHKGVYGFVTGVVADLLTQRPGPGQVHASLPGRLTGVGPVPRTRAGCAGR